MEASLFLDSGPTWAARDGETLWGWGAIARPFLDEWAGGLNWEPGITWSSKSTAQPSLHWKSSSGEVLVSRGPPHGPGHFHIDWTPGPSKVNPIYLKLQPNLPRSNTNQINVLTFTVMLGMNTYMHVCVCVCVFSVWYFYKFQRRYWPYSINIYIIWKFIFQSYFTFPSLSVSTYISLAQ